ncbi:hypothetical protein CY34DRAFT_810560 [Suillus luteus UH-Slu-Lm8-n1]|uniref:Uncharacterized protein n=1 Tax=Suillus luteus UH-Slu-Lm8-n1 TaxID=930992 RepID=A0A0D0ASH9_9AGAM|nr:hypothetical protein CY34DRAFT_810560 [Suillus luteus UH-Slu-Lm8-n1]
MKKCLPHTLDLPIGIVHRERKAWIQNFSSGGHCIYAWIEREDIGFEYKAGAAVQFCNSKNKSRCATVALTARCIGCSGC